MNLVGKWDALLLLRQCTLHTSAERIAAAAALILVHHVPKITPTLVGGQTAQSSVVVVVPVPHH